MLKTKGEKITVMVDNVYDSFHNNYTNLSYLAKRAIVCPTNTTVDGINDFILGRVPGDPREYLSCDTLSNSMDRTADIELLYPLEFLNSINVPNFPRHRLLLKVGVPIVLLRNLIQSMGLCNGTRIVITRLGNRLLEGNIMTGITAGQSICIPRISLNTGKSKWPFFL